MSGPGGVGVCSWGGVGGAGVMYGPGAVVVSGLGGWCLVWGECLVQGSLVWGVSALGVGGGGVWSGGVVSGLGMVFGRG